VAAKVGKLPEKTVLKRLSPAIIDERKVPHFPLALERKQQKWTRFRGFCCPYTTILSFLYLGWA